MIRLKGLFSLLLVLIAIGLPGCESKPKEDPADLDPDLRNERIQKMQKQPLTKPPGK